MILKFLPDFEKYFDSALDLLYSNMSKDLTPVMKHFIECARYNVPHGKKIRGILCVAACNAFSPSQLTPEKIRAANLVGWCIEFMQSGFLIHDDLVDRSPLRRGQQSWHLVQKNLGRGLISVNDGLHLYLCVQQLLFAALSGSSLQPTLLNLVKLFGDAAHFTCLGQALDLLASNRQESSSIEREDKEADASSLPPHKVQNVILDKRLKNMDNEHFMAIVKWKTSYYSFVLPVTAGMILAGVDDDSLLEDAKAILLRIGEYFQAQDDFLDVFVDDTVTGKIGTDIADGKCSWLIAAALARASVSQLEILERHYGIPDSTSIAAVRKVFADLDLPTVFEAYENKTQSEISSLIDRFCLAQSRTSTGDKGENGVRKFFHEILDLLYKRKK